MMCVFICKKDQDLFSLFNEIKWSNNNCELRAVWHNTPYAVSFSNIKCHYIRLRVKIRVSENTTRTNGNEFIIISIEASSTRNCNY